MNKNYRIEKNKTYLNIESETREDIKNKRLPLVCLSSLNIAQPLDFKYIVLDKDSNVRGKFIELDDAEEYAELLSNK